MIYFLRHGLDDERFVGGWSDVPLIEEGVKQIKETIQKMLDSNIEIDRVISSDVVRAYQTAWMVAESYQLNEVKKEVVFREQNKGILNGMLLEEAQNEYPEYFENVTPDTIYLEGESLRDLQERIREYLDYIMSLEDKTIIVTHRGVINMLYYILNDIPLDMDKKKFFVSHASLHALDKNKKVIRKVI